MSLQIWVRCGDADDYNAFDGYDEVASYFAEMGVQKINIKKYGDFGAKAKGFTGRNYISLYWGDADAQVVKNLTTRERHLINSSLEYYTRPVAR